MRRQLWIHSIVLPALAIIGGTAGSVLARGSAVDAQTAAAYERQQLRRLVPMFDVLTAKTASAHGIVASWNTILGQDDTKYLDPTPIEVSVAKLTEVLRAERLPNDQAAPLAAAASSLRNPDAKQRYGDYRKVLHELSASGRSVARGHGERIERTAASLEVLDAVVDAHDEIMTMRTGRGVDAMPPTPDVRKYVAGYIASLGRPDPELVTLGDVLAFPLQRDGIPAAKFRSLTKASSAQAMAAEAKWALAQGLNEVRHPSAAELTTSTHATIAAVAGVLATDLTKARKDTQDAISRAENRASLLKTGFVGWLIVAFIGLACLIRRVHITFARLRRASEIDDLTAVNNRAGLRAATEPWFASRQHTLGLAVIDLDRFKSLNDTFGHLAGDSALRIVAARISAEVIASRTVVSRWGGDEFVVAMQLSGPDVVDAAQTVENMTSIAERVRAALSLPADIDGTLVAMAASIGGCVCTCGACALDDLFRVADRRLYDVKRAERNAVLVHRCGRAGNRSSRAGTSATKAAVAATEATTTESSVRSS